MLDLKGLLERKRAEKEAAAQVAVAAAEMQKAAAEAQKIAAVKVAAEVAEKIFAAKTLVFEILALGEPDEETVGVLNAQYAELPGLREAVEQEMRWKQVAAFEKRIANLPTDQLSYDLATELVEFGALEEITPERKDVIFAYNKTVREAGNSARQTFVRQAFQKEGKISHYYLDRKRWLGDALNKHHRALEQNRKMLVRHDVMPTYSFGSGTHKPDLDTAFKAAVSPPVPEVAPVVEAPRPPRKVRRAGKQTTHEEGATTGRPGTDDVDPVKAIADGVAEYEAGRAS